MAARRAYRQGKINQAQLDTVQNFLVTGTDEQWGDIQAACAVQVQKAGLGTVGSINWSAILTFLQGLLPMIEQIINMFKPPSAGVRKLKPSPHQQKKVSKKCLG